MIKRFLVVGVDENGISQEWEHDGAATLGAFVNALETAGVEVVVTPLESVVAKRKRPRRIVKGLAKPFKRRRRNASETA